MHPYLRTSLLAAVTSLVIFYAQRKGPPPPVQQTELTAPVAPDRAPAVRITAAPPVRSPEFLAAVAGTAGAPMRTGGTVQLLNNGVAFFPPDNGAFTFDSFTSNFTIDVLSAPVTLDNSRILYTLFTNVPVVAVPEPGTWAMMLLGFGGLGAVLRTRRHFGAGLAVAVRT